MGIGDHLDDFAQAHSATTWKKFEDVIDWKRQVLDRLNDPAQRVLFNLDSVKVWPGVSRAAGGRGGATDWELLQIMRNKFPSLGFWKAGNEVNNLFD